MMKNEQRYIRKRKTKASLQSIPFYLSRIFPIRKNKVVFCTIEGTTGFTCNPKYIALEMIRRNAEEGTDYELVWLVNDTTKQFPKEIHVVKNTLWNRAYHLSTAKYWIDNSRKQLEARKRKGQIYIQTWHAKLGFKPTCLDRGDSFSEIAYLVSKHDSDLVDYWLSNSDWYDKTLKTGSLYEGKTIRSGSPRCDVLINGREEWHAKVRKLYQLPENAKLIMYAPTFRGGSQSTNRTVAGNDDHMPDFDQLIEALEQKTGEHWYVLLRLHPQLTARNIGTQKQNQRLIDVSKYDDMYELLAGCDAFMTDYSSAAFDAAVMKIPVILYVDDYQEYIEERGKLLWELEELPFLLAENDSELMKRIHEFRQEQYEQALEKLSKETGMQEDGCGAGEIVDFLNTV